MKKDYIPPQVAPYTGVLQQVNNKEALQTIQPLQILQKAKILEKPMNNLEAHKKTRGKMKAQLAQVQLTKVVMNQVEVVLDRHHQKLQPLEVKVEVTGTQTEEIEGEAQAVVENQVLLDQTSAYTGRGSRNIRREQCRKHNMRTRWSSQYIRIHCTGIDTWRDSIDGVKVIYLMDKRVINL